MRIEIGNAIFGYTSTEGFYYDRVRTVVGVKDNVYDFFGDNDSKGGKLSSFVSATLEFYNPKYGGV